MVALTLEAKRYSVMVMEGGSVQDVLIAQLNAAQPPIQGCLGLGSETIVMVKEGDSPS